MPRYALIACPRCREHAQIVEKDGAKTTRCQRCGTLLKLRKLRIFHTSDRLDEVISARTNLQARMDGSTPEDGSSVFGNGLETTSLEDMKNFVDRRDKRPVKDPGKIIVGILQKQGGAMEVEILRTHALEYMDGDKFEKILKGLLDGGELYTPSTGLVRIV